MSPRTVEEWRAHWDAKAGLRDEIELNGYCVDGVPVDAALYQAAVIDPTLERLELEPNHCVLEVGCGTGSFLRALDARVAHVVGTDFSETLLRRYEGAAETYVCADHELPFEGEQFDRILMFSVAHYFPDLEYFRTVFVALLNLLRSPGILLIGDLPLGSQPEDSPFRWYDRPEIVNIVEPFGLPFSIAAQSRLKRAINHRYDLIVYRD